MAKLTKREKQEDAALDWLIHQANMGVLALSAHYDHICDGEVGKCGCEFEGEQ